MPVHRINFFGLQALVFALVSAAFTAIYPTQPVLPVIRQEVGVDEKHAFPTTCPLICPERRLGFQPTSSRSCT
jgi:hypothetical protein